MEVTYPRTANNDKELTVTRGEFLEVLDDSRSLFKFILLIQKNPFCTFIKSNNHPLYRVPQNFMIFPKVSVFCHLSLAKMGRYWVVFFSKLVNN